MQHQNLGSLAEKIALGTVQFGLDYGVSNSTGQVIDREAHQILALAYQKGVRTLDTARFYGTSEEIIGRFLQETRMPYRIITKIPPLNKAGGDVEHSLKLSLEKLGQTHIDTVLFHDEVDLLSSAGTQAWSALEDCRQKGLVSKIGVSSYSPHTLERLLTLFPLNTVQVPFNVLDRRFFSKRLCELFDSQNTEVHVRSVFLQGLLFMKSTALPSSMTFTKAPLEALEQICSLQNLTPAHLSLMMSLSHPQISKCVLGFTLAKELEEILNLQKIEISSQLWDMTAALWELGGEQLLDPRQWG